MSDGATSIDQLPVNTQAASTSSSPAQPISPPNSNNAQNIKIENYGQQLNAERSNESAPVAPIDYNAQLHSVLKEASASGATVLPSRDIPQNTLPIQHDQEIKPNFVPKQDNDYIGNILDRERVIQENKKKQNKSDNMDYIYQQLQLPLLVGLMYFIYQLPAVRKYVLVFLPTLFNKDGNPNLSGYLFNSVVFALLYTLLIKGIEFASN
jgi:hypothetical protein